MRYISEFEFYNRFNTGTVISDTFTEGLATKNEDLKLLRALCCFFNCKHVLELGVRYGHTAKYLLDNCACIEKYFGVDVPPTFIASTKKQQFEIPIQTGIIASEDDRFSSLVLDKGSVELVDKNDIEGFNFDLIFVDADHSRQGVERDSYISKKLLKKDGVIVWHDYGNERGVTDLLNHFSEFDDTFYHVIQTHCCFKVFGF